MKTEWDYSKLADAYIKRPNYSTEALDAMFDIMSLDVGMSVCDVGAGVGHLTIELASKGFIVNAVEPNDEMRRNGIERTKKYNNIKWSIGTGENTGMKDKTFSAVTFGSSFNVCNQNKTLIESKRIVKESGYFACMWNHRDITDKHQSNIESIIKKYVPQYDYGNRREDQYNFLRDSGFFKTITYINADTVHTQNKDDCVEAWRSHGTLHRQAGNNFYKIIDEIEGYLTKNSLNNIQIPYNTKIWLGKFKHLPS